jgi:hypothetical protein
MRRRRRRRIFREMPRLPGNWVHEPASWLSALEPGLGYAHYEIERERESFRLYI